jgi:ribosomal protein L11 methyltransferase
VVAIDNEEWAYNNCVENTVANSCSRIVCLHGDDSYTFNEKFEVILANINRHVILSNMAKWKSLLNTKGVLIVSGILQSDERMILEEATGLGFTTNKTVHNNGWLAISFHLPQ